MDKMEDELQTFTVKITEMDFKNLTLTLRLWVLVWKFLLLVFLTLFITY